ncbi:RteC domain-containing protein [Flavobacterium sp.]|uniref:RteC domain-containing protein n=1 Tax=Flavobacterium sp. TaxID=239 RepID=UPI002B4A976C|nr:RteC domain-containing protein [Flavobacterium sp.]WRH73278.1 MAG: RteC domain-containing protein [Flavobacterium sp.]
MKNFTNRLLIELENQLEETQTIEDDPIKKLEVAIEYVVISLEKLKAFFKNYNLNNKQDEIYFFKEIKPQFTSKLIYYNEIYNIEINKPIGDEKRIKKYYSKEIKKLKNFFTKNKEFYKYYRTKNTCLDKKYFLRKKYDIKLTLESYYFQSDPVFSTTHDYLIAKLIANEKIIIFLENKLNNQTANTTKKNDKNILKWTGTKVALVELVYALHNEKIINNGNISLNECIKAVENFFNTEIKQHNRIFLEIRNRKTIDKTNFINSLQVNLNNKINQLDE